MHALRHKHIRDGCLFTVFRHLSVTSHNTVIVLVFLYIFTIAASVHTH